MVKQAAALWTALVEARRWIGDGPFADGLHRDCWTPQYRAVIDRIDAVIVQNAPHVDAGMGLSGPQIAGVMDRDDRLEPFPNKASDA